MDDLDDMQGDEDTGGMGKSVRSPYQPDGFGGVTTDIEEEVLEEVDELLAA